MRDRLQRLIAMVRPGASTSSTEVQLRLLVAMADGDNDPAHALREPVHHVARVA